jgi:ketosteroid isomerase-like protein
MTKLTEQESLTKTTNPEDVVRKMYAAWERNDISGVLAALDPD